MTLETRRAQALVHARKAYGRRNAAYVYPRFRGSATWPHWVVLDRHAEPVATFPDTDLP